MKMQEEMRAILKTQPHGEGDTEPPIASAGSEVNFHPSSDDSDESDTEGKKSQETATDPI